MTMKQLPEHTMHSWMSGGWYCYTINYKYYKSYLQKLKNINFNIKQLNKILTYLLKSKIY